jgi:hypothetical protein
MEGKTDLLYHLGGTANPKRANGCTIPLPADKLLCWPSANSRLSRQKLSAMVGEARVDEQERERTVDRKTAVSRWQYDRVRFADGSKFESELIVEL